MEVERLIEDNPKFVLHQGILTSWAPHQQNSPLPIGYRRSGHVDAGDRLWANDRNLFHSGRKTYCITPDADEAERVKRYCAGLGLPENITFFIESSDKILPYNDPIPALDRVFIDGGHAFPAPILDW